MEDNYHDAGPTNQITEAQDVMASPIPKPQAICSHFFNFNPIIDK